MDAKAREIVERYGMAPLPVEGTLFAETYRGDAATAGVGLFCDDPPSRSLFHRLTFDEVWHFYEGDPLRLVLLDQDGSDREVILGGEVVQYVVPGGVWQAGELVPGGAWSFYGCTVAPPFTFDSFEGGEVGALLSAYPQRAADIERLAVRPER